MANETKRTFTNWPPLDAIVDKEGTIIGNTVIQGTLAAGSSPGILTFDGDLTLVDLAARRTIRAADQATRVGWTPFDGKEVTGWPIATVVRGHLVMRDGALVGAPVGRPVRFVETLVPVAPP